MIVIFLQSFVFCSSHFFCSASDCGPVVSSVDSLECGVCFVNKCTRIEPRQVLKNCPETTEKLAWSATPAWDLLRRRAETVCTSQLRCWPGPAPLIGFVLLPWRICGPFVHNLPTRWPRRKLTIRKLEWKRSCGYCTLPYLFPQTQRNVVWACCAHTSKV